MSTQQEVEDVLSCVQAGRTPRPHGPYQIHIGDALLKFRTARIEDPVPTGRQVLQAIGARPVTEHMVFQVLRGWELRELHLDETTDLRSGRVERFLVFEGAESFRFELDDRVLEWGALGITGLVLKLLAGVDPETHDVWLSERGKGDRKITDNETVKLDGRGLERFFTAQCARNGQSTPAEITITVNGTAVKVLGGKHTGAALKQAAIEAGASIELDFVLLLESGQGQTEPIGDHQFIEITCSTRFQAIADDDNS